MFARFSIILIAAFMLILSTQSLFAQREVTAVGVYQAEWLSSESKDQAQKRIKAQAIINGLEKEFGKAIFQGNSTYIQNVSNGQKVETKTGFNMVADSYVKGEVVEELKTDFEEIIGKKIIHGKQEEYTEIKCTVKFKAREFIEPPVEFLAETMNCTNIENCKTTSFKNADNFYLYFQSSVNGYLAIFLDDNTNAAILLPYEKNRPKYIEGFPVEATKEYILFKNDRKYCLPDMAVDELSWESSSGLEKLYVIFSAVPFAMPKLNENNSSVENGSLPQNLSSEDFMRWLIKNRREHKSLQYTTIVIQTLK